MNCQECRDYIDPYFDSELDAGDTVKVKQHLRDCPECRRHLRSREVLRKLLANPELKFAIPKELPVEVKAKVFSGGGSGQERIARKYSQPWLFVPLALAAAMTLFFGLLFLNKSGLLNRYNSQSLVGEVVSGHVRSLLVTHLLDVPSTDQHTVKPWFDGKLKFAPPVQDFAEQGFRLIGGRLDYLKGQEAAALVYQRNKHIINLFLWPAQPKASVSMHSFSRNGYNVVNWNHGGFQWWAVSDVSASDLERFAQLALERPPSNPGSAEPER
jgi:anti-sigma factor RsiW